MYGSLTGFDIREIPYVTAPFCEHLHHYILYKHPDTLLLWHLGVMTYKLTIQTFITPLNQI